MKEPNWSPIIEEKARIRWNRTASRWDQWGSLSDEEKIELIKEETYLIEEKAIARWDKDSDKWNKWDALSDYEKIELVKEELVLER